MDKQRDFEKGLEEYKAKKKQEVENIAKEVYENSQYSKVMSTEIARYIVKNNYRKIPKNAVVISKSEYNDLKGLKKHFDDFFIKEIVETRKETAEKFAERLKGKLNEWLEDNEDDDGKIDFGIAEIELIGVKSLDGEIIVESFIDEICKELTDNGVQNGN